MAYKSYSQLTQKDGELNKLRSHFDAVNTGSYGSASGKINDRKELVGHIQASLPAFVNEMSCRRVGRDPHEGFDVSPVALTLDSTSKQAFGVSFNQVLASLGVHSNMSLSDMSNQMGFKSIDLSDLTKMFTFHDNSVKKGLSFDAVSTDINAAFRWILPEYIIASIKLGYEGTAKYTNWISSTIQLGNNNEATMPYINRGNAIMEEISEGAPVPVGEVSFQEKKATTYKYGVGFKMTEELVRKSTLSYLQIFLTQFGTDINIGKDLKALDILINGEQSSNAESAPVIGVETQGSFNFNDFTRVMSRGSLLKRNWRKCILTENEALGLNALTEFKGYEGDQRLLRVQGLVQFPMNFEAELFPMVNNQIMFLDPANTMVQLNWIPMSIGTKDEPETGVQKTFIKDHFGFAITRRDGRVIVDKSIAYSGNQFPDYMDVMGRLTQGITRLQP